MCLQKRQTSTQSFSAYPRHLHEIQSFSAYLSSLAENLFIMITLSGVLAYWSYLGGLSIHQVYQTIQKVGTNFPVSDGLHAHNPQ